MGEAAEGRGSEAAGSRRAADAVFWLGFVTIVAISGLRYLRDGSFWLDEASVAINFMQLSVVDVFQQPLLAYQNFPRWYFSLIKGIQEIFGYHTSVLRFFPFLFSVIATFLWMRLLRMRFASVPILLAIAVTLNFLPTVWMAYSALLKQYTFDVFIALIPFCLGDDFYQRALGRGEKSWKGFALASLCALSFTAVIALLGRVGGWYAVGLARGRRSFSARGALLFAMGVAVFMACLWLTELRHTVDQQYLYEFHERCVIGGDWSRTHKVLDRMSVGWYSGGPEFYSGRALPDSMIFVLRVLFLIGIAGIVGGAFGRGSVAEAADEGWGSRSAGCLVAVGGLVAVSWLAQYPACAGRLTLFLFFPLQMVLMEGMAGVHAAIRRRSGGLPLAGAAAALLLACMIPGAYRNLSHMALDDVPSNMKPLLAYVRERPELTVLATPCSKRQIETHPGGLGAERVVVLPFDLDKERDLPWGEEVWLINAHRKPYCRFYMKSIVDLGVAQRKMHTSKNSADLFWVQLPDEPPEPPP